MESNFYSKCLENLKTAFDGYSMDVTTTGDRIVLTSKNGCFYEYLDIVLDFDDERLEIEGYADGYSRTSPVYLYFEDYDGKDFSYDYDGIDFNYFYDDVKKNIITVYGAIHNAIMNDMFERYV